MNIERTRKRLYRLPIVINGMALGFLAAVLLFGQATEPIVQWPADLIQFFTTELPAAFIAAALKFPIRAALLVVLMVAVFWMNRVLKLGDDEQAFRIWFRTWSGISTAAPPKVFVPSLTARIIAGFAAIWWLVFIAALLALTLWPPAPSGSSEAVAARAEKMGVCSETGHPCVRTSGLRLLGRDETARITVVAKRKRNETGLLLQKGGTYKSRVIEYTGWRDGSYIATPRGVEFEGWLRYWVKGMEWLRPYPQGKWFQLIGRIDHGRDVFPLLDQTYDQTSTRQFSTFQAPEEGELVLLVNDVIYGNNSGFLVVEIGGVGSE